MTVKIDKKDSKNLKKILNEKLKKTPKKGNLSKHFGKLKRNLDGLEYQNSIREIKIDLLLIQISSFTFTKEMKS